MTPTPHESHPIRSLLVPVFLPTFLGSTSAGMLITALPLYLTDIDLSVDVVGLILAFAGLGAALAAVPLGSRIARHGENRTAIDVLAIGMLTTAVLGWITAVPLLIALRLAAGSSQVGMRLSRQTWVTRRVDNAVRGRAMAWIGGSNRIGFFVGPVLGGVIVDTAGFTTAFVVSALFSALAMAPLVGRLPDPIPVRAEFAPQADRPKVLTAIARHRRLLARAALVPVLVLTVRAGREAILPLIGDDLELSATAVGAMVTASSAADLVLVPVSGFLMDRRGRLWGIVPALALIGLGFVALGMAWFAGSVAGVVLAGVLLGIGNGLSAGSMLTLGSDLAPADASAEFLAGYAVMQDFGRFVGPVAVGFVAAVASFGTSAFVMAGLVAAAIAWLVIAIGETRDLAPG